MNDLGASPHRACSGLPFRRSRSSDSSGRMAPARRTFHQLIGLAALQELTAQDVRHARTVVAEGGSSATAAIAHNALTWVVRPATPQHTPAPAFNRVDRRISRTAGMMLAVLSVGYQCPDRSHTPDTYRSSDIDPPLLVSDAWICWPQADVHNADVSSHAGLIRLANARAEDQRHGGIGVRCHAAEALRNRACAPARARPPSAADRLAVARTSAPVRFHCSASVRFGPLFV